MRPNSNKIASVVENSKFGNLITKAARLLTERLRWELKLTAGYLSLGLNLRQWTAVSLICLLLPVFGLPASAATVVGISEAVESAELPFEPANEPQPVWKNAANFVKLSFENITSEISSPAFYNEKGEKIDFIAKSKIEDVKSVSKKESEKAAVNTLKSNKKAESKDITETDESATSPGKTVSNNGAALMPKDSVKDYPAEANLKNQSVSPAVTNSAAVPVASPTPSLATMMPGKIVSGSESLRPLDPDPDPSPTPEPSPTPSIWTESQWRSQFTADNNLGSPKGQADAGFVSAGVTSMTRDSNKLSNFSFNLPIVSLPGRGINASVNVTYNSQVWNKSGDLYTYNIDRNWLSPGFNLSYGYLDFANFGANGGFNVISPDGTRHLLFYKGTDDSGNWSIYESADGEFVQTYRSNIGYFGGESNIWVKFADGLNVGYGSPDNWGRRYPNYIVDRNGNYLTISYLSDSTLPGSHGGRIEKIIDTLGREIIFHYDNNPNVAEKKLLSISAPGIDGSPRLEVVRFYYEDVPFQPQGRFEGTIGINFAAQSTVPSTINVLRYVYFPGTKTGYQYDYSTHFGMIYKITQLAGMQVSGTGVTSAGQWVNWTKYNYPGTDGTPPGRMLSDIPKYDKRFDEWQGRDQSTPYVNTYRIDEDQASQERTTRVFMPDGNISQTKTVWKPAAEVNGVWTEYWDDGLIKESTLLDGNENVLQKKIYAWQQGAQINGRRNPQLERVKFINETGQSTETVFSQYDGYNNPQVVTEYGFADANGNRPELKKTVTSYVTATGYKEVNLVHLPQKIEVYANGGSVPVSKIIYEYDDYQNMMANYPQPPPNITNRPDAVQFRDESNPFINHNIQVCGNWGCTTVLVEYVQARIKGNLTKVTAFSDASLPDNSSGMSVTTTKYDILGNAVEAGVNCCQQKVWEYLKLYEYAYPTKITKGSDVNLVSQAVYDYNTGLVTKTIDENNQETVYQYETDTLRQKKITYPNGGYTLTEYSDKLTSDPAQAVPGFVRTKTTLEANKIVQSYSYFDGRGAGIRSAAESPDGWSVSAVEYDALGRASKTFNPFYAVSPVDPIPGSVKWTQVLNYDKLGRATQVQMQDGGIAQSFFNEAVVNFTDADNQTRIGIASRAKDQAGKERRQIVDALGRVVRVDEPTDEGLGSLTAPKQPTFYSYDGNDNLSKIVQTEGSVRQERRFKYDSLSRLTHEKQVEATATLDANGVYGAPDPLNKWTKVLKYDAFGRMTEATDARGVETNFAQYDGLNRLKKVTFTDGTPEIRYTYDQARTGFFNKGALTRVETAQNAANPRADTPDTATEFDYDSMGRVRRHRQSIGAQSYNLEYNYNLAGQLTSEKYPSGKIVTTSYDAGGRLSNINDQGRSYLSGLQFQGKGNAISSMTLGNGIEQSFDYNDNLQVKQMTWAKAGSVVQRYDYTFGEMNAQNEFKNNGKLAQIDSYNGGSLANPTKQFTQKFDYDTVGRLKSETETRGDNNQQSYKQIFDYDRFGNRYLKAADNPVSQNPLLPVPIESNNIDQATNRFASNTGTTYDDAGNVTTDGKFRNLKYSYDANGRMFKTSSIDDLNQSNSVYDAAGQRVAQQINGVWKFFVYDVGGKMIAEYGGLPQADEGGVKYVHQDAQGSTRAITSVSGAVKSRSDYAAFGEEINASVGQRTAQGYASSDSLRQKYAQTERDEASGLDHTWFRKNENRAGRWTSPDPYNGSMNIGNPQSFNRYSYVENQPTNFVDPSGLNAEAPREGSRCTVNHVEGTILNGQCVAGVVTVSGGGGGGWMPIIIFGGPTWITPIGGDPGSFVLGDGADTVALALDRAVDILNKGCWTAEIGNGVKSKNESFADLDKSQTEGWGKAYSSHNNNAVESRVVATQKVTTTFPGGQITDRTMVGKIGNGVEETTYNYVVKYYDGEGAAVTYRTSDPSHYGAAIGFTLGADVNVQIAKNFLEAVKDKECKKE